MNERLSFGFCPWPAGVEAHNGFVPRSEGDWLALVERSSGEQDGPAGALGSAGLWRIVPHGTSLVRVHDLPPLRALERGGVAAFSSLLEWAEATFHGAPDPSWSPPERDEVASWLEPGGLRALSGALVARGELVHAARRLALVYPELARVPETLAADRRWWLDALLLDAQRRWRLVRFGVDPSTRRVQAEVDLSGVPAPLAPAFVQLALEALARAVAWVLSSLSFLVDPSATSRALERHSFEPLNWSHTT